MKACGSAAPTTGGWACPSSTNCGRASSVDVSYNRRWWGNTTIVDNQLITNADFDPYTITAPSDPRLPDGGGYVIGDHWAIKPAKFGATTNFEVPASDFGKYMRYFDAVDLNARGEVHGVTMRVATSTGRQVTDNCELIYDTPSQRNCHLDLPFQMAASALVAYTIPKVRVLLSGVFRSRRDRRFRRTTSCRRPWSRRRWAGRSPGAPQT